MTPGTSSALDHNISFVAGDTWRGIPLITITENGAAPADNAASAVMQFRTIPKSTTYLIELSTTGGEITIVSANDWTFTIPEQTLNLKPGTYAWSFRCTDVNAKITTYLEGQIQVLQPVTR